ncbi:hypothetical protein ACFL54_06420 [Planctomycetota bacterium]
MIKHSPRRAIVLLVVLGVLALLSVLAITFVQMTRLERHISKNYVDHIRAMVASESGIEYAIGRILDFQGGCILTKEFEDMSFTPGERGGLINAEKASFQAPEKSFPISGSVSSSYTEDGDYFILRVSDESGKLNLNDSNGSYNLDDDPDFDDPDIDPDMINAPGRLDMLVETLGDVLFGEPFGFNIANALFSTDEMYSRSAPNLPGARFSSLENVRDALTKGYPESSLPAVLSSEQFEIFLQEITIDTWQDPNVIRPTYTLELTLPPDKSFPGEGDEFGVTDGGGQGGFKYEDVAAGYDAIHIYLARDMQTKYFELEARSPVNINTANQTLIQAILAPLAGWYIEEGPADTWGHPGYRHCYYSYWYEDEYEYDVHTRIGTGGTNLLFGRARIARMTNEMAEDVAAALYTNIHGDGASIQPEPFETWQHFYQFLDTLVDDSLHPGSNPINGFTKVHADLLRANCNPNTRLNDFNPDAHIYQLIDKSQLTQYSTEFCFEPTGMFNITSLGQVTGADNKVNARYGLECTAELFRMFRITSQSQFMNGYEVPGDLADYFTETAVAHNTTAGACPGIPGGFTLQSYPEPIIDESSQPFTAADGDRNYIDDSIYDGYISLATWQNTRGDQFTDTFLLNFNNTLAPEAEPVEAEISFFLEEFMPWSYDEFFPEQFQFDFRFAYKTDEDPFKSNQPATNRLTHSRENATLAGVLYPDGAYSGRHRNLGYDALLIGNEAENYGMTGSINFWVKPNFNVGLSNRTRLLFSMGQDSWAVPDGHKLGLWYFPIGQDNSEDSLSRHFYEKVNMPPRTMVFGWNGTWGGPAQGVSQIDYTGVTRGTTTVTHDWHDEAYPGHGARPLYNFDSHQWSHVAVSWDLFGTPGGGLPSTSDFALNGVVVTDEQSGNHGALWEPPWPYNMVYSLHYEIYFSITHIMNTGTYETKGYREFANLGGDQNLSTDFSADCTYDDVFSHHIKLSTVQNAAFYSWGRYFNGADPARRGEIACYTSAPVNIQRSLHLPKDKRLILRSVSWTLYWPMTNRDASNSDLYIPTEGIDVNSNYCADPVLPDDWDPLLVDFEKNGEWIYDTDKDWMLAYAGGDRPKDCNGKYLNIHYSYDDTFAFRTYFNMGDNQALYNAPVLDDITFVYTFVKARIVSWKPKAV